MSSESKKEQKSNKKPEPPKEQRKPRNARAPEKKAIENDEKGSEKSLIDDNFGPEVIKISEESKYSKKVIQSNWQKYEEPINTYEECEQIENMGTDFEALLNTPISSGGHFQFKHEKAWDTPVQSTQYDKHFEINMSDLAVILLSIPFYERNDLQMDLFSESDIVSMKARSEKFKHQMKRGSDHCYDESSQILLYKLKDALTINTNKSPKDTKDQIILEEYSMNTNSDALEEIIGKSEGQNPAQYSPPNKADKLKGPVQDEDLEEWLDNFLVSSKK